MIIRALVDLASASTKGIETATQNFQNAMNIAIDGQKGRIEEVFAKAAGQGLRKQKGFVKQQEEISRLTQKIATTNSAILAKERVARLSPYISRGPPL